MGNNSSKGKRDAQLDEHNRRAVGDLKKHESLCDTQLDRYHLTRKGVRAYLVSLHRHGRRNVLFMSTESVVGCNEGFGAEPREWDLLLSASQLEASGRRCTYRSHHRDCIVPSPWTFYEPHVDTQDQRNKAGSQKDDDAEGQIARVVVEHHL